MAELTTDFIYRKIFFLNPPSIVQDELVFAIIRSGYEVYLLRDSAHLSALLKEFPGSIVLIYIDTGMGEKNWILYISQLVHDKELTDIRIGVLTYNNNMELSKVYLEEVKVSCGFINLKINKFESLAKILSIFDKIDAKGRRKHLRGKCTPEYSASLSFRKEKNLITGKILDISEVGLSCTFDTDVDFEEKQVLKEVSINLHGVIGKISGEVFKVRNDNNRCYVIMYKDCEQDVSDKIIQFLAHSLQRYIDQKVKAVRETASNETPQE